MNNNELLAGTKDEQRTDADFSTSASVEASPVLCARLSCLSLYIDDVSDFMKKEKEMFTEKYFKGKKAETMSFLERKELYSEYQKQWLKKKMNYIN